MNAQLSLRPISSLLGERFFIPAYQRGYRWTKRQVAELLSDLWEFQLLPEREAGSFYCLQPVVVKHRVETDDWELVDGQQRLTTIHLILTFLSDLLEAMDLSQFGLTYETRKGSEAFLKDVDLSKAGVNIDYHHICNAYAAIQQWFKDRPGSHRLKLLQTLINDDEAGRNVKVIWYELPETQPAIPAFTRLNVGKIPLTNSELVRALFLRSRNFETHAVSQEQLRIAQEWDTIEKALQSDAFWYFMHSGIESPQNRIEHIFDLHARANGWRAESDDAHSTFHFFFKRLEIEKVEAAEEWFRVKQAFMALEEWFEERVLYHLIGFLVHEGDDLRELQTLARETAKHVFDARLRRRIAQKIGLRIGDGTSSDLKQTIAGFLEDLEYGPKSARIRSTLLLFNIATLVVQPRSNVRFAFDAFKKEEWDIEHVKAVASEPPAKPATRRAWLQRVHNYFEGRTEVLALRERIEVALKDEVRLATDFEDLYIAILRAVGEENPAEVDNGIGNLTLLDAHTNRDYGNAIYPIKRQRVLEEDRAGTFVPLCTRNVFLKSYSREIANMLFWSPSDADAYRNEMAETLSKFFGGHRSAV